MRTRGILIAGAAAGLAGAALRLRHMSSYHGPVLGLDPNGRPGLAVVTGASAGLGAEFDSPPVGRGGL